MTQQVPQSPRMHVSQLTDDELLRALQLGYETQFGDDDPRTTPWEFVTQLDEEMTRRQLWGLYASRQRIGAF